MLVEILQECYKNNIMLYMPMEVNDYYNGEYRYYLDEDKALSKKIRSVDNKLYQQVYTNTNLINSVYSIGYNIKDIIKGALIEKDISALLINDFEIDRKLLAYLMGIE